MAKSRDDQIRELSARYNAAYRAHQIFAIAIAEFAMAGQQPPYLLQDTEKDAARELAQVTEELRVAMVTVAGEARSVETPGNLARRSTL